MSTITENTFPLQVFINGQEFIHYSAISVTRTVTQFIDTFSITCANPQGRYSTSIPVGSVISMKYDKIEFFRGYIEKKEVAMQEIGSSMTLSGREEIVLICESDIDPQTAQFKNTTDNAIIKKLLSGYSYELDIGAAVAIKEYNGNAGMKIAQVLEDVTKYSDSIIIKKGTKLMKRKLPTGPTGKPIPLRVTKADGQFTIYNSRILNISFSEDVTKATGYMTSYSYERGKTKTSIHSKKENTTLTSGKYAAKLRNLTTMVGMKMKNIRWFSSTAKEQSEVEAQTKRALRESDIDIDVTVTIAGLFPVELLDTVDVYIEQEKIQQYMYIEGIKYSLDQSNKLVTILNIKPYPSVSI